MTAAEQYTYQVFWSEEDDAFVATVAEFPSLSCIEDTQADAFFGLVELVSDILGDIAEGEETPPVPLDYS